MSTLDPSLAWVRDEDAPRLPPPPNMTGIAGWVGDQPVLDAGTTAS